MNLRFLNWKKHVDVVVGLGVWLVTMWVTPEKLDLLAIGLGIAAYFVTQQVFPESKKQ